MTTDLYRAEVRVRVALGGVDGQGVVRVVVRVRVAEVEGTDFEAQTRSPVGSVHSSAHTAYARTHWGSAASGPVISRQSAATVSRSLSWRRPCPFGHGQGWSGSADFGASDPDHRTPTLTTRSGQGRKP
jgi:hypothetical protein